MPFHRCETKTHISRLTLSNAALGVSEWEVGRGWVEQTGCHLLTWKRKGEKGEAVWVPTAKCK